MTGCKKLYAERRRKGRGRNAQQCVRTIAAVNLSILLCMPELPEVEVTRRGLAPHLVGRTLTEVVARTASLRGSLNELGVLEGLRLVKLTRRAKFLVWEFENAAGVKTWLLTHMGMSGSWRVYSEPWPEVQKHEHVDFVFGSTLARYRDPRRFGSMTVFHEAPFTEPPLSKLGPEPFDPSLTDDVFWASLKKTHRPIKEVLLSGSAVVGCGNIYANEALFKAGIRPQRAADAISRARAARLLSAVRNTLSEAIEEGGSTLRDFHGADGASGWFALHTLVYDREGKPCPVCGEPIRRIVLGGRSTYFCPKCQK